MKAEEPVALRYLTQCLDGRRIPLNSAERHNIPGEIPYWGSGGVVGTVGEYLFDERLVLLGEDGAPFYDRNRDVAFKVSGKTWVNNHIHVLRPNADVDHAFLTYALNSVDYSLYISGSTRDKLTQEDMRRILVPMWQFERQRRIARFLDRETRQIDELIGKQERLIELLAEKRQAIITHAVSKGLDPTAPTKPSGSIWFESLPIHWKHIQMKQTARKITDGAHISPETDNGEFDFVSTKDVRASGIDFDGALKTSLESYRYMVSAGCRPHVGDVLFSKDGTIGKTAIVEEDREFVVASSLIIIRPDRKTIHDKFLDFACQSKPVQAQVVSYAKGAGLPRLSIANLRRVQIPRPPLEEQILIAEHLLAKTSAMDYLTARAEEAIHLLSERRSALISAAVTGKIDIQEGAA